MGFLSSTWVSIRVLMASHAKARHSFRTEHEFVHWLQAHTTGKTRGVRAGIGDDAALVRIPPRHDVILKADLSVEGVHFSSRIHPPRAVGHRALARSLSDIAAMGGTPRFALVSLALSKPTTRAWIEQFYRGLLDLAARFDVAVVGGDTAFTPGRTLIDAMVVGEVPSGQAILRSGAKPGDRIFVSGRLGLSALGLAMLDRESSHRGPRLAEFAPAVRAHLFPEPCCALGRYLSRSRLASAAIDLSDGLSTDLHHLCEASGVGARIFEDSLPLVDSAGLSRSRRLRLALDGGEDYQLLFTVPLAKTSRIPSRFAGASISAIGEIRKSREVVLVRSDGKTSVLEPRGYDHFSRTYSR